MPIPPPPSPSKPQLNLLRKHIVTVTDLQGPPSERTQLEKIRDLKSLAQQYARDRGSCDDVHISYLEDLEDRDSDNLRLAQMLAM
jgi:phage FluMu protein gp41